MIAVRALLYGVAVFIVLMGSLYLGLAVEEGLAWAFGGGEPHASLRTLLFGGIVMGVVIACFLEDWT